MKAELNAKTEIFLIIVITLETLLSKIQKSATFSTSDTNEKRNRKDRKWCKNFHTINKIIIVSVLFAAAFTIGIPTYRASNPYHSTSNYKEKNLSPQPFAHE